jgi:hypothetical protein
MATEEEKAIEYRRMMLARDRNQKARELALAGDPEARRALLDAWDPLIKALREANEAPSAD